MKVMAIRFVNVFARLSTLASKFGFLFFIAKFLKTSEVGQYGLISAAVIYAVGFVGLEFHVYSNRKLIVSPDVHKGFILKNTVVLYFFSYATSFPLLSLLFFFEFLPFNHLVIFYFLVMVEHFSLELYRILTALSRNLSASIILFIKSALWFFLIAPLLAFSEIYQNLQTILVFWLLGGTLASCYGLYKLKDLVCLAVSAPINKNWIINGLKKTLLFYFSTIFVVLMLTADRFLIQHLGGLMQVAPYVIFIGVANAMISLVEAGVFVFYYPKLIAIASSSNYLKFKRLYKKMAMQAISAFLLLAIIATIFSTIAFSYIDNVVYINSENILFIILLSSFFKILSMIPQYALTAFRRDNFVAIVNFLTVALFFLIVFSLGPWIKEKSVPTSLVIVYFFQWIAKQIACHYYLRIKQKDWNLQKKTINW